MPYAAVINRKNPSCFLFLVDQSGSMMKPFGGNATKSKAQGVADAINRLLQNLILKCAKGDGIRDYFRIGVIGYGGTTAAPKLAGPLAGQRLVPIGALAEHPLRIEERIRKADDGAGGLVDQSFKFPVWFEPKGEGKTPMCQALGLAREILTEFIGQYPASYPPIVVNITDGSATDGPPEALAARIRSVATSDGNVLMYNLHLSSLKLAAVEYPDHENVLPDGYARMLFRMSSVLPQKIREAALSEGYPVTAQTRGFVFNADLVAVVRFLDIGTRIAQTVR